MLRQPFSWTDHAVDLMRRLIDEGNSATMIGTALGCSRNAVIGKASRLKIPLATTNRPTGSAVYSRAQHLNDRRRRRAAGLPADPQEFDGFDLASPPTPRTPKTISQGLDSNDCRWPMGPIGGEETFCCEETVTGCSWCPEHRARVFVPRVIRDQAPVRVARARS